MDNSAFVPTSALPSSAFYSSSFFAKSSYVSCPQTSPKQQQQHATTPFQMSAGFTLNVFERLSRIVKSNVNAALSGMEDPEKIIEQTMKDMEGDLVKVRQAYAEVSASTKRLERQREQAASLMQQWYERAQLALTKGEETLAREALTKKKAQEEIVTSLDSQLSAMQNNTKALYEKMQMLDAKIGEARLKKDQYIARAKTAKTSQKVNEMIGSVGNSSSAMDAFERMKMKVESLETEAEVTAQLTGAPDTSLEGKFRALEQGSVDDELMKMKNQLKGTSQFSLPSADPAIENELERMRREKDRFSHN